jgi:hypothetical protein
VNRKGDGRWPSVEWKAAVAQAEADGTFFISTPHHCAVGIKPPMTVA